MKSFKEHLTENEDFSDKVEYHLKKAHWHSDKSKYHKDITDHMTKEYKANGTPAPTILSHSVASNGHKDAAKWHSYASSMYSMKKVDAAKEFAVQAENASKAANNRSKSLE